MGDIFFKLQIIVCLASTALCHEFRCDYEYDADVDGWLKFHMIPATWHDARLRCHLEDLHFIITGVPLSEIPITWANDEPDNLFNNESCLFLNPDRNVGDMDCTETRPYVCYKNYDDEESIGECGIMDDDYFFSNKTGSCYKFHTIPRSYSRAVMACAAEGGYLAIINTKTEAKIIASSFSHSLPSQMSKLCPEDEAYMGFSDWNEHGEWLTFHGESLQKAGYSKWYSGDPNYHSMKHCGGVDSAGLLISLNCDTPHYFICEKDPESLLCDEEK
ncbi:unnamed protein product, partial [Brenthis ino]